MIIEWQKTNQNFQFSSEVKWILDKQIEAVSKANKLKKKTEKNMEILTRKKQKGWGLYEAIEEEMMPRIG